MGSLEFFKMDEEGAGWVSFEQLDEETKLDIEIALFQEGAL
jgi:predicted HTH domain antitoxin